MEALKDIKIIAEIKMVEGRCFYFFQIPGKGFIFKFHARPQTDAYSCLNSFVTILAFAS